MEVRPSDLFGLVLRRRGALARHCGPDGDGQSVLTFRTAELAERYRRQVAGPDWTVSQLAPDEFWAEIGRHPGVRWLAVVTGADDGGFHYRYVDLQNLYPL